MQAIKTTICKDSSILKRIYPGCAYNGVCLSFGPSYTEKCGFYAVVFDDENGCKVERCYFQEDEK